MISWHPPQVLIWFGQLPITFYGVTMAVAIGLAVVWILRRTRRTALPLALVEDVLFWTVLGGILGARLGFLLQQDAAFLSNAGRWIALWDGGLSFHGALIGGILAALIFLKSKRQLDLFPRIADLGAAPILLAAAIGRLGNWANQELYGGPTDVPWSIVIDTAHRLPGYENFISFHPTFAYEAIINILGCILLLMIESKTQKLKAKISDKNASLFSLFAFRLTPPGTLGLLALGWYAIARGVTEIWRISDRVIGPLSAAQLISLLILVGVAWSLTRQREAT